MNERCHQASDSHLLMTLSYSVAYLDLVSLYLLLQQIYLFKPHGQEDTSLFCICLDPTKILFQLLTSTYLLIDLNIVRFILGRVIKVFVMAKSQSTV